MHVLTLFNQKGGVGKTTLSSLIGAGLAIKGYRVLMLDADGQGDLSTNMRFQKQAAFTRFVSDWNPDHPDYVDVRDLVKRVPPEVCPENLYIVPGGERTWGIPGSMNLGNIVRGMATRLATLKSIFDYVVIDTQPSATTLHDALGLVTDWFLLPTDTEALSAFGALNETLEAIRGVHEQAVARGMNKANVLGILPNRYRAATRLHQEVLEMLIEQHGDLVWDPMPLRTNIPEAQLYRTTLMVDAPEMKTNDLIWQIVNRVEAETQGKGVTVERA